MIQRKSIQAGPPRVNLFTAKFDAQQDMVVEGEYQDRRYIEENNPDMDGESKDDPSLETAIRNVQSCLARRSFGIVDAFEVDPAADQKSVNCQHPDFSGCGELWTSYTSFVL